MVKKLRWKVAIAMLLCFVAGVMNCGVREVKAETLYYEDGDDKWKYVILDDNTVEITGYYGNHTDITIPDKIDEMSVTSIGNEAFEFQASLTSIKIPSGVTNIGNHAFTQCRITGIDLPESVTTIGEGAFSSCESLKSINLPKKVTGIEDYTFYYCSSLTSVEMPSGVTSIGDLAFSHCSRLTNIKIPENVTSIGEEAFQLCTRLTSIKIPNKVANIGRQAFTSCSSVTSIVVDDGNKVYDSRDNCNAIIETSSDKLIRGCTQTIIPNGVKIIGSNAFSSCNLTSINIPNGVTTIEGGAFYSCKSLTSVDIPKSVTSIGGYAFSYCSSLTSIELPDGLISIDQYAFSGCSRLGSITIPGSVTSIGHAVFYSCPQNMVIYTVKGSYAEQWAKDNNITVELLDGGTTGTPTTQTKPDNTDTPTTGDKEQSGGTGTQSTLPKVGTQKTLSSGKYKVTASSSKSKAVTFVKPKSSTKTSLTIPATVKIDGQTYKVTEVAAKAFKNNKKLKSVTIGKNVKKIGKEAFSGCKKLNKITIKSTILKSVGKNAIKGINTKATIKCPKKQLTKYKKLFKSNTGYKKTMKIKK